MIAQNLAHPDARKHMPAEMQGKTSFTIEDAQKLLNNNQTHQLALYQKSGPEGWSARDTHELAWMSKALSAADQPQKRHTPRTVTTGGEGSEDFPVVAYEVGAEDTGTSDWTTQSAIDTAGATQDWFGMELPSAPSGETTGPSKAKPKRRTTTTRRPVRTRKPKPKPEPPDTPAARMLKRMQQQKAREQANQFGKFNESKLVSTIRKSLVKKYLSEINVRRDQPMPIDQQENERMKQFGKLTETELVSIVRETLAHEFLREAQTVTLKDYEAHVASEDPETGAKCPVGMTDVGGQCVGVAGGTFTKETGYVPPSHVRKKEIADTVQSQMIGSTSTMSPHQSLRHRKRVETPTELELTLGDQPQSLEAVPVGGAGLSDEERSAIPSGMGKRLEREESTLGGLGTTAGSGGELKVISAPPKTTTPRSDSAWANSPSVAALTRGGYKKALEKKGWTDEISDDERNAMMAQTAADLAAAAASSAQVKATRGGAEPIPASGQWAGTSGTVPISITDLNDSERTELLDIEDQGTSAAQHKNPRIRDVWAGRQQTGLSDADRMKHGSGPWRSKDLKKSDPDHPDYERKVIKLKSTVRKKPKKKPEGDTPAARMLKRMQQQKAREKRANQFGKFTEERLREAVRVMLRKSMNDYK
jgi:hypothetical protein